MGRAMRLGLELGVTTLVGAFLGYLLDKLFGTKPWLMIIGLILGTLAGFRAAYHLVKNEQQKS